MRQRRRNLLSSALFAICVAGPAAAADPLGPYVGAAVGQAQIATDVSDPFVTLSDRFKKNHFAFKVMVGLRPISLLGAELSYMDFGDPSGTLFAHPADASMRGVSAFGILYLPSRLSTCLRRPVPHTFTVRRAAVPPYPRLFVALHLRFNWTARIRVSQRESGLS